MNAVLFTQSFDACVGHGVKSNVSEQYRGETIDIEEFDNGAVQYYVNGRTGLMRVKSVAEARKYAREAIDNMVKDRRATIK